MGFWGCMDEVRGGVLGVNSKFSVIGGVGVGWFESMVED